VNPRAGLDILEKQNISRGLGLIPAGEKEESETKADVAKIGPK
jgi:hypothetical protein